MANYIPDLVKTPEQLFIFLKSIFNYTSDPRGVELLQSVPTLMQRNGKGDCDCGTILTLASSYYLGFGPLYVSLVGNNARSPSHIYSEVFDKDKREIVAMDLTNPYYGMEREYEYKQRIGFKI
jgi:hypothetical protein